MSQGPPHLLHCMARLEVKAVFAVAFLCKSRDFEGSYAIDAYATPGEEGPTSSWLELFRRTVRFLAFQHGVAFQGLTPKRDGRILARVVEPRNQIYVTLLESGGLPNIPDALREAIRASENWQGFDAEPLRAALADVEQSLADLRDGVDPDQMGALMKLRQRAMAEAGFVPGGDGEIN